MDVVDITIDDAVADALLALMLPPTRPARPLAIKKHPSSFEA